MVGEEFPARLRGRAIAVLISLATVGVMAMAKLQPYVLLPEGAESNALHGLGSWLVGDRPGCPRSAADGASWRALYALSLLPLVLILALRFAMRETRRFEAARAAAPAPRRTLREVLHDAAVPWRAEYRARTAMVDAALELRLPGDRARRSSTG